MPNTDWLKVIARSRQSSVSFRCKRRVKWWKRIYCCGKQEINTAIFPLVLKVDQCGAVNSLLDGHDVLAVLATGFGKCLIFQVFVIVFEMERERLQTTLVFCPQQSIINDQISKARNMSFSALSVAD